MSGYVSWFNSHSLYHRTVRKPMGLPKRQLAPDMIRLVVDREEVSNDGAGVELGYGFGGSWGLFPQSIPR